MSSGWKNTSRSPSEMERGEKEEKSGEGKICLPIAAESTELPGAAHGSRAALRWFCASDLVLLWAA